MSKPVYDLTSFVKFSQFGCRGWIEFDDDTMTTSVLCFNRPDETSTTRTTRIESREPFNLDQEKIHTMNSTYIVPMGLTVMRSSK